MSLELSPLYNSLFCLAFLGALQVKLAKILPWEELIKIYSKSLSRDKGRYGIDGRLAVGSMIIKHRLNLSDREVIDTLQENIYLQYFVGFHSFKKEKAFDASLFVHLRKRLGLEAFDEMTQTIIAISEGQTERRTGKKRPNQKPEDKAKGNDAKAKTNKGIYCPQYKRDSFTEETFIKSWGT